jgi:hypothetical protein
MTEKEQFQHYRLVPPWRRWLIIAFGILLPVFFAAIGCSVIIVSHAPIWAMAIGVILGLGCALVIGTLDLFALYSKKMRAWLGGISAAMLLITLRLTAEWATQHPVSLAFSAGYIFSYSVGLFVGFLCFNASLARPRT